MGVNYSGIIVSYVMPEAVRKISSSLLDDTTLQRDVDVIGTNNATKQPLLTSGQTGSVNKPSLPSPGSQLIVVVTVNHVDYRRPRRTLRRSCNMYMSHILSRYPKWFKLIRLGKQWPNYMMNHRDLPRKRYNFLTMRSFMTQMQG